LAVLLDYLHISGLNFRSNQCKFQLIFYRRSWW